MVYRLRRPWPNASGATHLILDPLDFLRRLAALVSFPGAHQTRRHGVFANRSRLRKLLPPPPPSRYAEEISPDVAADVTAVAGESPPAAGAAGMTEPSARPSRPRSSWAQLLRRVLSVDALSCPRCSSREQSVPMVVLAFLSDPAVVSRILRHLGLPLAAPALAPARSSGEARGFEPFAAERSVGDGECEDDGERGSGPERGPPG